MAKFEKVARFKYLDLKMPERKTAHSAGYDICAAKDIVIPPYMEQVEDLLNLYTNEKKLEEPIGLKDMADFTKGHRPTLIPTGVKCKLEPDAYLELSIRSSSPLKYWLILANGVGIIDADYYNNEDNEGEIMFQVINLSPIEIKIQNGDIIGQGIIKKYFITEDDCATGERTGGFGSTTVTE